MPDTPQTRAPAYQAGLQDADFMTRRELRPVRLQLELLKPEMELDAHGIVSTVVLFGGARAPRPRRRPRPHARPWPRWPRTMTRRAASPGLMTERSLASGGHEHVIVTGGGPGVMEAGNLGAAEAGGGPSG
jgi:predicted Rossmann-fold nucleotide-binding protein